MVRETVWNGKNVYVLSNKILTLLINPADGMNIYDIVYHDISIIKWDEERFLKGLTYGIPILFPTPNRVEEDKIRFEGNTYDAKMHGLVRNAKFTVDKEKNKADSCELKAYLEWNQETAEDFYMFPFESRLEINILLQDNCISYRYQIKNQSDKNMPYGFGIHPFFNKITDKVEIKLPLGWAMEMNDKKLPNAKEIDNLGFDLSEGIYVRDNQLDHVFADCTNELKAQIFYEDFQINLRATEDFNYVVVYTPKQDFFCVENQTCATNAHNLYDDGYKKESGLLIIEPGEIKSGMLQFEFVKQN